jgi:hypothetical protein
VPVQTNIVVQQQEIELPGRDPREPFPDVLGDIDIVPVRGQDGLQTLSGVRVTANDENAQRHSSVPLSNRYAAFYSEHKKAKRLNKSAISAIATERRGKPEV